MRRSKGSCGRPALLRARLARAAVMAGDLETAAAALDGVETDGGRDDGEILLAKGNLAYFTSDFDTATTVADEAPARAGGRPHVAGARSHRPAGSPRPPPGRMVRPHRHRATADQRGARRGQRCLRRLPLPRGVPALRPDAVSRRHRDGSAAARHGQRSGALRAAAFAAALIGEAALLSGDLDVAGRELQDAVDLHHDLGSAAGEAHSLQRLAEVYVAKGDRPTAVELLHRAVSLARWSMIAMHLLQRIFGTLIIAAPDPIAARATVDRASPHSARTTRARSVP